MEQLSKITEDIENLLEKIEKKSLPNEQIIEKLRLVAHSLDNLRMRNRKRKRKRLRKRLRSMVIAKRIKNVSDDLDKIDKSEIELRKDTNNSLDDIRLRNMMFQGFVSLLFGLQAGLNPERWWTLFSMVMSMAFSSIWIVQKVGFELWSFRKKFRDLYKKQNKIYLDGEVLIVDWKVSEEKHKFSAELKEDFSKFHKSLTLDKKRVGNMGWTYLGNFIFYSVFSLTVPVLLYFVLMAISERDAATSTHPPSTP
ncbi:uncharacterized protein LOC113355217 isoform X2 [Papaver somniferum]|uniref:uncharacterized protein LOC113355217 isoform X2 n=1 Tax=Papaver somniferum TaxID=3469 RepID=UPI000E7059CA|nr:uncharacterized protein LOC113355217 isoform X2 [Papaver somniferum]